MSYSPWFLTAVLIGTNTVMLQPLAVAKSTVEVGRIAKAITVEIKQNGTDKVGSGILLQKQGSTYTVLTAGHVVSDSRATFTVKTSDGQDRRAIAGSVRSSESNIDLAVLKFESSDDYFLAIIGTSSSLEIGTSLYVSGFPKATRTIEKGTFNFTKGEVIGIANRGNDKGYSLIYSNITFRGMSGGPVLNENGELVAIHGQGDRDDENVSATGIGEKTGRNLGIVIERFGTVALSMGVKLDQRVAVLPQNQGLNATDYLLRGKDKEDRLKDYRGALIDYNQAIALDPKNPGAFMSRAFLKAYKLNDPQGALADCNKAISLAPRNSTYYYQRGFLKREKLNDFQGALADYSKGIALDPDPDDTYEVRLWRADLKIDLNDFQGALADYNQAIALQPKLAAAYYGRANLKYTKLNDFQGALADYNQAIALGSESESASSYYGRANLKHYKLNDFQGALVDYNRAIVLNPKSYEAYSHRGWLKSQQLNDLQGGLADSNRAIAINPEYSNGYYRRAFIKQNKLNDPQGTLADYNQVIALEPESYQAYGNRGWLKYQQLSDLQGALADLNRAIAINSKYSTGYYRRALIKQNKLNDKVGAIKDFRQAAKLFREQGQTQSLQKAIDQLRLLGVSE
jgi:tetratricopeptide (TPR) repeat protein/V8-like Glu-specific endopeptidase